MAEPIRVTRPDAGCAEGSALHPAWEAFIRYCRQMGHGEIQRLSIQDGLPVLAEQVVSKVKFTRERRG